MSNNGKQGERLAKDMFTSWGYQVQDVSADPEYYYKGDLILTSPTTGQQKIVEVKWDTRIANTGNLYLEYWNRNSKAQGGRGWIKWCGADYLAYGDAQNRKFYIFDLAQLKERASTMPLRFKRCGDDSEGQIVALADVEDLILNKEGN